MNVADYICRCLLLYNVRFIFGYPGAAIIPLMNAIEKTPQLDWILTRHEETAALSASAYAKLTGDLGVCMATTGPGATNLITGLIDADTDRAPVLAITGLVSTDKRGLSHFQDADHVNIFKSICGLSIECEHPYQIPQLLEYVLGYIIQNRKVAHLAIAADIQTMTVKPIKHKVHKKVKLMKPPEEAIRYVADNLNTLNNIVIAVGPRAQGVGAQIIALSNTIKAPIITSFAGKGTVDESHPNNFGVLGLYGAPANKIAMEIIKKAETVIAIGIDDLFYFLTNHSVTQQRELIQLENDITMVSALYVHKYLLLGDFKKMLISLACKLNGKGKSLLEHAQKIRKQIYKKANNTLKSARGTIAPAIFFQAINAFIDQKQTILSFDIGDNAVWASKSITLTKNQRVLVSNRIGTMGFSIGSIIAAKLAKPNHTVIGIIGDGGLQMLLGELLSIVQLKLNVILIVLDNGMLQRVLAQETRAIGVKLLNPNYTLLAQATGWEIFDIKSQEDIQKKIAKAFAIKNKPVLIHVCCDPKIFAEIVTWTK